MKNKYEFKWVTISENCPPVPVTIDKTVKYNYDQKSKKVTERFSFYEILSTSEEKKHALTHEFDDMN
jgi:hypothetical protein